MSHGISGLGGGGGAGVQTSDKVQYKSSRSSLFILGKRDDELSFAKYTVRVSPSFSSLLLAVMASTAATASKK